MAEIVNLRQMRKRRRRVAARAEADENAVRHGQSKATRSLIKAREKKATRELDGHRLEDDDA